MSFYFLLLLLLLFFLGGGKGKIGRKQQKKYIQHSILGVLESECGWMHEVGALKDERIHSSAQAGFG